MSHDHRRYFTLYAVLCLRGHLSLYFYFNGLYKPYNSRQNVFIRQTQKSLYHSTVVKAFLHPLRENTQIIHAQGTLAYEKESTASIPQKIKNIYGKYYWTCTTSEVPTYDEYTYNIRSDKSGSDWND